MAALRTASGKDASSVSLIPGFFSTTDLHRNTGTLDSLATPIANILDDIDNEARDLNKPDIGADERYPITAVPAISINDVSVTEGNSGTTNAVFTVLLSQRTTQTVTVNFSTANGTATTADNDYSSTSGMVTFNPLDTVEQISISVNGDTKDEPNETFIVNLTNPSNATIADGQGIGTILNDDSQPTISINDISVNEGNAGTTNAIFTVTLSQVSAQTVTVNFATVNGTATVANNDYVAKSGTLTFLPGTTVQFDTILVNGDATNEPDETFFVNLSGATNATIADGQGLCTIHNDDGVPNITINDVSATEGNSGTTPAVFVVSLSTSSSQIVTVNFATAAGTATAGIDYVNSSGTITFNPGETLKRDTVLVVGDLLNEADETFFVNLSNPINAVIGDAQGVGVIINDDPLPSLSINDVSVIEGNSGTTTAQFTVKLTPASGRTVTVKYATANVTAVAPSDYVATSGILTFIAGDTAKQISVIVNGDLSNEADETYWVNLTDPIFDIILDDQGTCTIINDDQPGANLALTKTDLPDPVYINAALVYTINVTNAGPDPASNVVVRDTLPPGVSYQSSSGTGWTIINASGIVTSTRSSLAVGPAPAITITVTSPSTAGTISNPAVVSSSTLDNDLSNNRDVEQTTVVAGIDLSIIKLDSPDPVTAGGALTYTINVMNSGPGDASSVVVRDVMSPGVTCVSASGNGWACSPVGGIVTCTRPLLSAGTAPSITIIGTAPPNAGIISNTATVSGAVTDPVASNNSTTITTTVNPVSTITQAIQNLIRQVECLVSSGILNAGNGNALIAKLHAALQSVDRGNSMSAANQLQAFINEVNALMQSGRLSASDGQPLIAGATVAINLLPAIEPGNLDGRSAITVLDASTPTEYVLSQNYPNPFNPATAIQFSIVTPGRVSLIIYNTLGEEVARLIDRDAPPGKYEIRWDASQLQSGIYFYRLLTRDFVETKKLIMMK
ncbi:MAG: DUF11 domain-containing protein [Ignavibacteria bacterium]|nr:DUF11 domain-containing protein [Ignavibacteria bacterium]